MIKENDVLQKTSGVKKIVNIFLRERAISIFLMIIVIIIVMFFIRPDIFFSYDNLRVILNNMVFDATIVIGMTVVMVGGGFDLSVGSIQSLTALVTAQALLIWKWDVLPAILLGMLCSLIIGILNGSVIAKIGVNPFITTLATRSLVKGIAILIGAKGFFYIPPGIDKIGQTQLFGLIVPFWVMLFLIIVVQLLMWKNKYFRQYYYLGGNEKAAVLSGIKVGKIKTISYIISAVMAGLAGVFFVARMSAAVTSVGEGAELRAITAVILGGASLSGGRGSILGSFLGIIFMRILDNTLIIARVSSYWSLVAVGVILLIAVISDTVTRRLKG